MNTRQYKNLNAKRVINTKLGEFESSVQNGLAVTPSQMLRMTEKGIAIAPANMPESMISESDFTSENDFSVNKEFERGVDLNSLWEAEQDIKAKFRKARKDKQAWETVSKGGE